MPLEPLSIRILCAADLHLGRQLADPLDDRSPIVRGWQRLIDHCLGCEVAPDLLLLAGDLVDNRDAFLENYFLFREGVRKVAQRGTQVVAIFGNHDPHRAKTNNFPGITFLGMDSEWERFSLSVRGTTVHIDGLSFSGEVMTGNPLTKHQLPSVPAGELLIGLLHADVGASAASPYGPCQLTDFSLLPHKLWVLGHQHIPRWIERTACRSCLYCGSLQGLDITEQGLHGAWELQLSSRGELLSAELVPLAPLLWWETALDLSSFHQKALEQEVPFSRSEYWLPLIVSWMEEQLSEQLIAALGSELPATEAVALRLHLRGRTPLFSLIERLRDRIEKEPLLLQIGPRAIRCSFESLKSELLPHYSLEELSKGKDFVAALARHLILCREKSSDQQARLEAKAVAFLRSDSTCKQCSGCWPELETVSSLYERQGYALLDQLLQQKEGAS